MVNKNTFLPRKIANRMSLWGEFLTKRDKVKGLPLELGIEVISICNLRCIMCPYEEMVMKKTRPMTKMSMRVFKKIIDEIKPFVELIYLHGLGEPLLHPKIFEFIKYAKKRGVKVGISTNAMLLNRENSQKLLDSGIDYVILAMDGARKKTYEKIRVGGKFERVEKNIKEFLRLKKKSKRAPFTVLQFITMKENENEQELFLNKWQGKGVDVVRIKPKIALRKRDKKKAGQATPYCFHIFRQMNVYADGTVVACCEDVHGKYPLANVKNKSLKEIWNNQKMRKLRKINFEDKRGQVSICRTCTYPQPSLLEATGVLMVDHLTVKKILPFIENWTRKKTASGLD